MTSAGASDHIFVLAPIERRDHWDRMLRKRNYRVSFTEGTENQRLGLASDSIVDLVIAEPSLPDDPADFVLNLRAHPSLATAHILLLVSDESFGSLPARMPVDRRMDIMPISTEPGALLVRLALRLRERKLEAERVVHEATLESQNSMLRELTHRLKKDLNEAQQIQQAILPRSLPHDDAFEISAAYLPLEEVGGDIYDVVRLDDGRYLIFVGDVTGHGLAAAFLGAMTKMALVYAGKSNAPDTLMDMTKALSAVMPDGRFVTAAVGFYDSTSGLLDLAVAGHPPPLVYWSRSGTVETLGPRGLPLGLAIPAPYERARVQLEPGDSLVFYTDGMTEARNLSGEFFGADRLRAALGEAAPNAINAKSIIDHLVTSEETFTGGRIHRDDRTLIALRRN